EDEYAEYQNDLADYHVDFGDYSTNEQTMDGTASLIYLLSSQETTDRVTMDDYGEIRKGKCIVEQISLFFTAHDFADGKEAVINALSKSKVPGSFFLTGDFLRNPEHADFIHAIKKDHYVGPHSDKHLLYADWGHRDSTLVSRSEFVEDLDQNYLALEKFGIDRKMNSVFLPSYEWYNQDIVRWATAEGVQLVNYTPGLRTAADYTYPEMGNR